MSKQMDNAQHDQAIMEQMNAVVAEERQAPPIDPTPHNLLDDNGPLMKQLQGHDAFLNQVRWLASQTGQDTAQQALSKQHGAHTATNTATGASNKNKMTHYRVVRRDGNCFLRSALFSFFSAVISHPPPSQPITVELNPIAAALIRNVELLRPRLRAMYNEFVDDFVDVLTDGLKETVQEWASVWNKEAGAERKDQTATIQSMLNSVIARLSDMGTTEYYVMALRYMIALFLKEQAGAMESFLIDGSTIEEHCRTAVETVGAESEQLHITALCGALGVNALVVSLDNGAEQPSLVYSGCCEVRSMVGLADDTTTYGGDTGVIITALFRPGHYDVLC